MNKILLDYFKKDELASEVWLNKYSFKNEITPDDTHRRLAKEFAKIELKYNTIKNYKNLSDYGNTFKYLTEDEIFNLFKDFKYIIPGGSVISGLGNNKPVSLSNCFVINSPGDSIESIMHSARDMAQIYKRRGGVGLDISNLRPNKSFVNNASNTSTGSVSFMDLFSKITEIIGQEGRRGALMISIDVNHPDVLEFIKIKQDLSKVTGANISVKVNNEFMKAVENNEDYYLTWPVVKDFKLINSSDFEYNILYTDSKNTLYFKKVKAKEIWNSLIEATWKSAEPGILNWGEIIDYDPSSIYDELKPVCTNPCGELPLGAYDSCRLIAVNLYSLIDKPFTKNAKLNDKLAYEIFYKCQILADDLVDLELEAVDRILNKINPSWETKKNKKEITNVLLQFQTQEFKLWHRIREIGQLGRRTGTGITGLGDFYAALNLEYGNEAITEQLFKIKLKAELDASIDMSIKRGSFTLYDKNLENPSEGFANKWYKFINDEFKSQFDRMSNYGRRNVGLSTCAPTGSISILTGTTSGIEPLFLPYYTRRKKCNPDEKPDYVDQNGVGFKEFVVIHPKFNEWYKVFCEENNIVYVPLINPDKESIQQLFKYSPWYLQTANDIDWEQRVKTQSLIQKYITSSISSTVNLPKNTPKETVEKLYLEAFKQSLKGITVYVDGSRSGILVENNTTDVLDKTFKKRPKVLEADYYQIKSKGIQYIVLVGLLDNKPYEIFTFKPLKPVNIKTHKGTITKIKKGQYSYDSEHIHIDDLQLSTENVEEKACSLYTSMLLRHNADIKFIIKTAGKVNSNISSFSSAMCRVLSKYINPEEIGNEVCPECGGRLIKAEGCTKCIDCSYSKC